MEKLLADAGLSHAVIVDSAGTSAYHIGAKPDQRSILAAKKRGYEISGQRARRVEFEDFNDFNLILAADSSNLSSLLEDAPHEARNKIKLILDYSNCKTKDIPDPYYGGEAGFNNVLDLLEDACRNIIKQEVCS